MSTPGSYEPAEPQEGPGSSRRTPHDEFEDLYVETTPAVQPPPHLPVPVDRVDRSELTASERELQRHARKRVLKRRNFYRGLVSYLSISLMLIMIWAVTSGSGSFFWPVFPIMGMGIGVVGRAWDTFRNDDDADVEREIERMRRKSIG